jgi:lactoylglutathione lyase
MRVRCLLWSLPVLVCVHSAPIRAQVKSRSVDHIHFSVPEPEKAQEWYMKNLGGVQGEAPDRVVWSGMPYAGHPPLPVQLMWAKSPEKPQVGAGAGIDYLAFSFPSVDAKVKELEAAGIKVTPMPKVPGLWKRAAIEDPWGVRIMLIEDPSLLGFHHVGLRVPDPEESLKWYVDQFGGTRTKLKGKIDAVRYGNMYVVVTKGDVIAPSQGIGINHLGFAVTDIDATAARLKANGVKYTAEPSTKLNKYGHRVSFVEAPAGVRVEIVEHTNCMFTARPNEVSIR